jgi:glutamyl-tRNA synthetase
MVRVRFAPSPTGYLHIGGARTALFNWLFARRQGGVFVLRIEDTDLERSSSEMVDGILVGMRWLGLDWDEGPEVGGPFGPYFQSGRLDRYRALAGRLVASGHAYYCYCTAGELAARREAVERGGGVWRYDRQCCHLTLDDVEARERDGRPRAVRVRVPAGATSFEDSVHGRIEFDGANIEDFVILRSDGQPTYHLSVVSDDIEMQITHVVRGDDHISNTPKQLLLYQAAGATPPQFAHVPLILGADRKRLSKRHGATSVMEYARQGYLPEAMVNFLALLGWSPGSGDREIFTRSELAGIFGLEGISGSSAVFNPEKLDWFNQQHMLRLTLDNLVDRVRPSLQEAGLWAEAYDGEKREWLHAVLDLLRPRGKKLGDFAVLGRFFFVDKVEYDESAVEKHLRAAGMAGHLEALRTAFGRLPAFDPDGLEGALRHVAEERGVKSAALIHATRVAITGRAASPGLFETVVLVGRDRVDTRLAGAVRMVASPTR